MHASPRSLDAMSVEKLCTQFDETKVQRIAAEKNRDALKKQVESYSPEVHKVLTVLAMLSTSLLLLHPLTAPYAKAAVIWVLPISMSFYGLHRSVEKEHAKEALRAEELVKCEKDIIRALGRKGVACPATLMELSGFEAESRALRKPSIGDLVRLANDFSAVHQRNSPGPNVAQPALATSPSFMGMGQ